MPRRISSELPYPPGRQHLAEAQVTQTRRDSRKLGTGTSRPGDRAEDMCAVSVQVHPQIPVLVRNEIGSADACATVRDVHMAGVERGVEHPDCDARSGDAGESFRDRVVLSKTIRTHDGHGRVVVGRHHRHGFNRQHEIGGHDLRERRCRQICRITAQIPVIGAHDHPKPRQRLTPLARGIRGHQRDVDRYQLPGGS